VEGAKVVGAKFKPSVVPARAGPRSSNPRRLISIRLPEDVIDRWKATDPGWQTRMAKRLSKVR
jgi:uncharacterized protein (DUF4415 family)